MFSKARASVININKVEHREYFKIYAFQDVRVVEESKHGPLVVVAESIPICHAMPRHAKDRRRSIP